MMAQSLVVLGCVLLQVIIADSSKELATAAASQTHRRPDDRISPSAQFPDLKMRTPYGPYCGVYSLVACLNAVGVATEVQGLVTARFVGSRKGSSAGELIQAAKDRGAHTRCYLHLSHQDLERAETPMILHMRNSREDNKFEHWVAFLGFDEDRVRILDPPHPTQTFSMAEVMANWDGMAIIVSNAPISNSILWESRINYVLFFLILFPGVCFLRRFSNRSQQTGIGIAWHERIKRLAMQMCLLGGVSVMLAFVYHVVSEVGFLRNRTAVAEVTRRFYSSEFPNITLSQMVQAVREGEILIIDARHQRDYDAGAIPGAISIPVSSSLPERQTILRGISRSQQIIVYCQSERCGYAEGVTQFLKFNGYENLAVYPGGYREWEGHTDQEAKRLLGKRPVSMDSAELDE